MSVPLSAARDQRGEVVAVERIGAMVELTARLPHLARTARPGQFAQVRCGDGLTPLLRRPFSVAWTEDDTASFVFAPVGLGTRLLSGLRPGDSIQVLGPLGTGFAVDGAAPRHLCVSGGLGCAPFPLLVRELRRAGAARVVVANGAATAALLYPAQRFRRGDDGVDVVEYTLDGSVGERGVVTDAVPSHCDAGTAVAACGPNRMMAALRGVVASGGVAPLRVEVSLEAPMGCGWGTCLGCALPVRDGATARWALCCREGPVLPMDLVDWDALVQLPPAHVA
ncbi:MAG: dihydroorotate dehydrogenase electron transfer subunit [Candidatus Dormibacteria bacterium]